MLDKLLNKIKEEKNYYFEIADYDMYSNLKKYETKMLENDFKTNEIEDLKKLFSKINENDFNSFDDYGTYKNFLMYINMIKNFNNFNLEHKINKNYSEIPFNERTAALSKMEEFVKKIDLNKYEQSINFLNVGCESLENFINNHVDILNYDNYYCNFFIILDNVIDVNNFNADLFKENLMNTIDKIGVPEFENNDFKKELSINLLGAYTYYCSLVKNITEEIEEDVSVEINPYKQIIDELKPTFDFTLYDEMTEEVLGKIKNTVNTLCEHNETINLFKNYVIDCKINNKKINLKLEEFNIDGIKNKMIDMNEKKVTKNDLKIV